jgi:hypothetical protein
MTMSHLSYKCQEMRQMSKTKVDTAYQFYLMF